MRILIIDDDMSYSFIKLLSYETGGDIIQANSVTTAIAEISNKEIPYDFVILDIMMPVQINEYQFIDDSSGQFTGLKLLDFFNDKLEIDIPIIVMTARCDLASVLANKKNVIAYLRKPTSVEEIVRIINNQINTTTN